MNKAIYIIFLSTLSLYNVFAQKETNTWVMSNYLVDFNSTPVSTVTAPIPSISPTSCISDANGNLLFYATGQTVYNYQFQVMANGSNLFGVNYGSQNSLIVKQPQSPNIYYVFTHDAAGYHYSIVDMTLAAGLGSVTVKNNLLWNNAGFTGGLTATEHCNGVDYWIVGHHKTDAKFHSFLLSSVGVSTVPVISSTGKVLSQPAGGHSIRISANGKKLGLVNITYQAGGEITMHDFDNSTGAVSNNSVVLTGTYPFLPTFEFSPNGQLVYSPNGPIGSAQAANIFLKQWNLCAGNEQAINASMQQISAAYSGTVNGGLINHSELRNASDGKLYIAIRSQTWLGVIHNPDSIGLACNLDNQYILTYPQTNASMPDLINSDMRRSPIPVKAPVVSCQQATFNALTSAVCAASGYSILSSYWNFGDPASGINNTSTASQAVHFYGSLGTYTAMFIANYQCTSDTIRQVITISNAVPNFSVTGNATICPKQSATLTANGPYTYTWSSGGNTNSVVLSPTVNTQYSVTATNTLNGCSSAAKVFTVYAAKCTNLFEEENGGNAFMVYPNPNNGNFTIETVLPHAQLNVFNHLGQLVHQTAVVAGKQTLNLQHLPQGIYFAELQNGKQKHVFKLVKEE